MTKTYAETIPADRLIPPHSVRDNGKLADLIAAMESEGWIGRPILAMDDGNGYHAWTGSHRIAAAVELGLSVPCLVMEPPSLEEWDAAGHDEDETFGWASDDDELLAQLEGLPGYEDATDLMRAEVEAD